MTNKVIIDYTKCKYNTFDGGGSQRTICSLDGKYCDCLRDKECYYKQLQRKTQECEKMKAEMKQIKKDLRKRFSVQNVSDGEINKEWRENARIYCSKFEEYTEADN